MRLHRSAVAVLTLALSAFASGAAAQDTTAVESASEIRVVSAGVGAAVQDRELVGAADAFNSDIGTVYFHTTLEGDFDGQIEHVWKRGGEEMGRVTLNARGPRWRTWSSKQIMPEWTGDWTVEVHDSNGNVLETVSFTVN